MKDDSRFTLHFAPLVKRFLNYDWHIFLQSLISRFGCAIIRLQTPTICHKVSCRS